MLSHGQESPTKTGNMWQNEESVVPMEKHQNLAIEGRKWELIFTDWTLSQ